MRRLIIIFVLLSTLCVGTNYASCDTPVGSVGGGGSNNGGDNNGGNNGNGGGNGGTGTGSGLGSIDIDDIVCPPGKGGRSLIPTVEAYADSFDSRIEIIFNRDLGAATAIIIDSQGYAVSSAECDTSLFDAVYLPMPMQPGFYTIRVSAREYLGEGYFEL